MNRAYSVALTGAIATGKSAVAERFSRLGVPVFDADVIARDLVAPGQPALAEIVAAFGAEMAVKGELDRARMRALVFSDVAARRRLEAILHPRVHAVLCARTESCAEPYGILAIPLFAECRSDYLWVDRILATDTPRDEQRRRLLHRPGIDAATADHMIDAQAPRAQRLALAQDVIDNTGPIAVLDRIVERLHTLYLRLAAAKARMPARG